MTLQNLIDQTLEKRGRAEMGSWPNRFARFIETWPDDKEYMSIMATGPLYKESDRQKAFEDSEFIVFAATEMANLALAARVLREALEKYKNVSASVQTIDMAAREALAAADKICGGGEYEHKSLGMCARFNGE